jgi:hypothetical protein
MDVTLEIASTRDAEVDSITKLLRYKRQIILQGPPGTGKTYLAKDVAEMLLTGNVSSDKRTQGDILRTCPEYKIVQFHPSYTYEDFVRGIEVKTDGANAAQYVPVDRVLAKFAKVAARTPDKAHILIIDEINRANLSAVLGELIYALEYRGQAVDSMYGVRERDPSGIETENHQLVLPRNLYIIGTMNTADRSAGHLDYAIRRRFAFVEVRPRALDLSTFDSVLFEKVKYLFTTDNFRTHSEYLSEEFRPKDVALGHSYFIRKGKSPESMAVQLEYDIKPILFEYVKDGVLKDSALQRINALNVELPKALPPLDFKYQRQLLLDTIAYFENITGNKYQLWSHHHLSSARNHIYKRVYVAPLLNNGSLHYEFLLDTETNEITIDFHIESNDQLHEEVARVLTRFSPESLGLTNAQASLTENWQRKKVGYRFALSNIEQSPRSLAEAMVNLINNSAEELRRPLLGRAHAAPIREQKTLL